jgi:hypothetical protein
MVMKTQLERLKEENLRLTSKVLKAKEKLSKERS